jgi:hypothetical protein
MEKTDFIANFKTAISKCKMKPSRFHWLLGIGYFAMTIEIGCWLLVILKFALNRLLVILQSALSYLVGMGQYPVWGKDTCSSMPLPFVLFPGQNLA